MTQLHHSIVQLLMPLCLKENADHEAKLATPKSANKKAAALLKVAVDAKGKAINADYCRFVLEMASVITGETNLVEQFNKSLESGTVSFSPMCVVEYKEHLLIVVHGTKLECLRHNGEIKGLSSPKLAKIATAEQVEQCLENLNEAQLRTIVSSPHFAAALTPLFQPQTELVAEEKKD